ncbi:MAG: CBS domain-containing protein [Bacteroidales bacterium]
MIAKQFISPLPEPSQFTDTGADVLYHLDANRLEDIPVVENNILIGSILESEIFAMADLDTPLKDQKITLKKVFVFEHQHIYDIINVMASSGLTAIPVLDNQDNYLGCILVQHLIKPLATLLSADSPGAIIILELNQNDFVLSQITQLVESQDMKILSLSIEPDKDSTKMDVILKLNTMEIQGLIQTLNRYNYIIKATYTEDENMMNDLRDRYDSLMKYLSI